MINSLNYLRSEIDQTVLATLAIIIIVGLVTLYSADHNQSNQFISQIANIVLGLIGLFVLSQTRPKVIFSYIPFIFIISIMLLIWVKFFGLESNGAQRWIDIGIIKFQPSELMKFTAPLMLAWFYQKNEHNINISSHGIALIISSVPFYLILKQPDLGTALMISFSALAIIFTAGLPRKLLIGSSFALLIASPFIWHALEKYQQARILSLIDPFQDALGSGYQTIQSLIALGSGGMIGKGWMNSSQTQLNFLPEATTDFIFAVFSEEFGFIGVLAIMMVYIIFFMRLSFMASRMQDTFSRLATLGLIVSIFSGVIVNLGMISGLLPIVGAPLPFFSYGGTSMVVSLVSIGIIMSLYSHKSLIAN